MRFEELPQEKVGLVEKYVRSLKFIFRELRKIQNDIYGELDLVSNENLQEERILFLIRELTNNVYSGCEVINEMFISLYRNNDKYRGSSLANGFTGNFTKVYNYKSKSETSKNKIYSDMFLARFYIQAEEWYVVLHDIRTQETHYYLGQVYLQEGIVYYRTENRNGISKNLYTNYEREIVRPVTEISKLIDGFLKTENLLCEIIIQ